MSKILPIRHLVSRNKILSEEFAHGTFLALLDCARRYEIEIHPSSVHPFKFKGTITKHHMIRKREVVGSHCVGTLYYQLLSTFVMALLHTFLY